MQLGAHGDAKVEGREGVCNFPMTVLLLYYCACVCVCCWSMMSLTSSKDE